MDRSQLPSVTCLPRLAATVPPAVARSVPAPCGRPLIVPPGPEGGSWGSDPWAKGLPGGFPLCLGGANGPPVSSEALQD